MAAIVCARDFAVLPKTDPAWAKLTAPERLRRKVERALYNMRVCETKLAALEEGANKARWGPKWEADRAQWVSQWVQLRAKLPLTGIEFTSVGEGSKRRRVMVQNNAESGLTWGVYCAQLDTPRRSAILKAAVAAKVAAPPFQSGPVEGPPAPKWEEDSKAAEEVWGSPYAAGALLQEQEQQQQRADAFMDQDVVPESPIYTPATSPVYVGSPAASWSPHNVPAPVEEEVQNCVNKWLEAPTEEVQQLMVSVNLVVAPAAEFPVSLQLSPL